MFIEILSPLKISHLGNIKLQKLQPIQIQQYYVNIMDKKDQSPKTDKSMRTLHIPERVYNYY